MPSSEREKLYLSQLWFEDRDCDIRCATKKMVTTRKPKTCCGNGWGEAHEMPAGSRMLEERAIFEGKWASWALCTDCMDSWLREIGELPSDDEQTAEERECESKGGCLCWADGRWLGDNCSLTWNESGVRDGE